MKKKNISLNTSFPDENVIICGDSDAISRAVLNILNNAIKFSYEGKSIEMSLNKDNSNAIIKVKDYGIGISEEDLPHLFEEFYRSKDMAAKSVSGTGLGLTITKHIIDAHKGQIIVNSTPGNGSEFIIKFPV